MYKHFTLTDLSRIGPPLTSVTSLSASFLLVDLDGAVGQQMRALRDMPCAAGGVDLLGARVGAAAVAGVIGPIAGAPAAGVAAAGPGEAGAAPTAEPAIAEIWAFAVLYIAVSLATAQAGLEGLAAGCLAAAFLTVLPVAVEAATGRTLGTAIPTQPAGAVLAASANVLAGYSRCAARSLHAALAAVRRVQVVAVLRATRGAPSARHQQRSALGVNHERAAAAARAATM